MAEAKGKGMAERRERRGSYGNIEEMLKRKREGLGEEELFNKSRKTIRSPGKKRDGDLEDMIRGWREEMEEVLKEVRGIKEWREELKQMKEEVKEGIKEQGNLMRGEIEGMRRELKEREEKWRVEKEEMRRSLEGLERKVMKLERKEAEERIAKGGRGDVGEGSIERRMREVEKKVEMREREEKKRNILIRGMEVKEGKRREMVEETMRRIGVEVSIEEVRRIGGDREKDREAVLVRLGSEEQRREVLMKKSKLRGRRERIMEDWTWKERKMRWKLEEIARKEENAGRRVRIAYGRIKIGNTWWRWDEEEEVLKDEGGKAREEQGEGEGGGALDRG